MTDLPLNKNHRAFICKKCNTVFTNKSKLSQHIQRITSCGVIDDQMIADELGAKIQDTIYKFYTLEDKPKQQRVLKVAQKQLAALYRYDKLCEDELDKICTAIEDMKLSLENNGP